LKIFVIASKARRIRGGSPDVKLKEIINTMIKQSNPFDSDDDDDLVAPQPVQDLYERDTIPTREFLVYPSSPPNRRSRS
jgi:hypothetical protein